MSGIGLGLGMWNLFLNQPGAVSFEGSVPECSPDVPAATWHTWEPLDESGLVVWLRASEAVPGATYTWPNEGSLGDWTQGTAANQPHDPAEWTNGQDAIYFQRDQGNGDAEYLNGPDLSGLTEGHMFVAWEADADPSTAGGGTGGFGVYGTDALDNHIPHSDGNVYDDFGTTARKSCGNPSASLADPNIYEVYSKTNDWANFVNGAALFSTGTNTVAFSATPRIGLSGGAIAMSAHVGEKLIYDHKLGTTAQTNARRYLALKFNITLA